LSGQPFAHLALTAAGEPDAVVWGSNSSTAKEAMKELAAAESERAALIAYINPRVVS
jgi:hypothetical protein